MIRHRIYCTNRDDLRHDEACLVVLNVLNISLGLWKSTEDCYKCGMQFWLVVPPVDAIAIIVPIYTTMSIKYEDELSTISSCVTSYKFEQHGYYRYITDFSCDLIQVISFPDYPYSSFLVFAVIVTALWVFQMFLVHINFKGWLLKSIHEKLHKKSQKQTEIVEPNSRRVSRVQHLQKVVYDEEMDEDIVVELTSRGTNTVPVEELDELPRFEPQELEFVEFESLLAFKGLVVTLWVFIKMEGYTFPFMRQSPWEGLTLDDILYGWFYWVLAASFYLYMTYLLATDESRMNVLLGTVWLRGLLYIGGGLIYNNINNTSPKLQGLLHQYPSLKYIRPYGIFQRVGLAHIVTSSVEACVIRRDIKLNSSFQDLKDSWLQWTVMAVIAVLHTCITFLLPVPGCPTGYIGPGGRRNPPEHVKCTGGAAAYIDKMFVSDNHLLPTRALDGVNPVYFFETPFDPEGLLGTLTTCLLMALAMQASRIFIYYLHPPGRVARLVTWGLLQLLMSGLLCMFQRYEGPIPINRHLMSLSYVFVVSGLAYLTLAFLYLLINIYDVWSGFPFIYTGVNFLVMMVGSDLFAKTLPFMWGISENDMQNNTQFLLRAFWCVSAWTYVCYYLLKQRIVFPM